MERGGSILPVHLFLVSSILDLRSQYFGHSDISNEFFLDEAFLLVSPCADFRVTYALLFVIEIEIIRNRIREEENSPRSYREARNENFYAILVETKRDMEETCMSSMFHVMSRMD